MVVVSDSGPLISLALIDKLDLLKALYGEVCICESVWREVSVLIERFNIPQLYTLAGCVRRLTGKNTFAGIMDAGEAESAALYLELAADNLIIDDHDARLAAESHGIKCVGTLGVLIKAKQQGLLNELRPLFAALLDYKRYFKPALLNTILAECGEPPLD